MSTTGRSRQQWPCCLPTERVVPAPIFLKGKTSLCSSQRSDSLGFVLKPPPTMKSGIRLILSVFAMLPVITSFGQGPDQGPDSDCAEVDPTKPLKVFILAGQSNMQGHAKVSTIDPMRLDPKTAPILKEMRNADGSSRVCEGGGESPRVWEGEGRSSARIREVAVAGRSTRLVSSGRPGSRRYRRA